MLSLLLISTVAVYVDTADNLSEAQAGEIAEELRRAIQLRTEEETVLVRPPSGCEKDECVQVVTARTGASSVVSMVLIAGLDRTQVSVRRFSNRVLMSDAQAVAREAAWPTTMAGLAESLFPEVNRFELSQTVQVSKREEGPNALSWVLFGTGLAAVGVGTVLALTSGSPPQDDHVLFNEELAGFDSSSGRPVAIGFLAGGLALNVAAVLSLF